MKLALVTDAPLTNTHGTGNLLLRLLDGAPVSVTWFHSADVTAKTSLPSFAARRRRTMAGAWDTVRRRLPAFMRATAASEQHLRRWRHDLDSAASENLRQSDVILAVVHTVEGLHFVHDLVANAPGRPVVLWFMDLLMSPAELGDSPRLLPALADARIWAFNGRIKASLEELFPGRRHPIELHMFLGVPIPPRPTRVARALSADTRCVMIGNVWDTSVLPVLGDVWNRAATIHGFDLPLSWYGPESAFARVQSSGIRLDPRIRYEGHAEDLNALLGAADAAIVAFAHPAVSSVFSRHSFPSRVADYGANALPLFAICSAETTLADYLSDTGAGLYDPVFSIDHAAATCARFLTDAALRERCAAQARRFAETHFDLAQQRALFVAALQALRPGPDLGVSASPRRYP